jgi:hypothetical protein
MLVTPSQTSMKTIFPKKLESLAMKSNVSHYNFFLPVKDRGGMAR